MKKKSNALTVRADVPDLFLEIKSGTGSKSRPNVLSHDYKTYLANLNIFLRKFFLSEPHQKNSLNSFKI